MRLFYKALLPLDIIMQRVCPMLGSRHAAVQDDPATGSPVRLKAMFAKRGLQLCDLIGLIKEYYRTNVDSIYSG